MDPVVLPIGLSDSFDSLSMEFDGFDSLLGHVEHSTVQCPPTVVPAAPVPAASATATATAGKKTKGGRTYPTPARLPLDSSLNVPKRRSHIATILPQFSAVRAQILALAGVEKGKALSRFSKDDLDSLEALLFDNLNDAVYSRFQKGERHLKDDPAVVQELKRVVADLTSPPPPPPPPPAAAPAAPAPLPPPPAPPLMPAPLPPSPQHSASSAEADLLAKFDAPFAFEIPARRPRCTAAPLASSPSRSLAAVIKKRRVASTIPAPCISSMGDTVTVTVPVCGQVPRAVPHSFSFPVTPSASLASAAASIADRLTEYDFDLLVDGAQVSAGQLTRRRVVDCLSSLCVRVRCSNTA